MTRKEIAKRYYEKHKEKCLERNKQYRETKIEKVGLNIPDGVTKRQEQKIQSLYNNVLSSVYGSTQDSYEIKRSEINPNPYSTSVTIELGLKGDEGTMASILARNKAMFFIGKNGGLKHMNGATNNLKRTKTWFEAFYDYDSYKRK